LQFMKLVEITYTMIPPPLSALPAKYHAPISLLLHSLSTGLISYNLVRLSGLDEYYEELAFLLGVTHDIHQKLVGDGLSTPRKAKKYVREKLDQLGILEYYDKITRALDLDMCGKENPIRGVPKEIATICHIADMAQGRIEGIELLYWLRNKVKQLDPELTVRYYSIMIPQSFARSYAVIRLYNKYIRGKDHVALASPWGLYIITYEDELPEILEAKWDDLRIGCDNETKDLVIASYEEIVDAEREGKTTKLGGTVKAVGSELRQGLWSRFARMFYCRERLSDQPIYPILDKSFEGLFVNIRFTDVKFEEIPREKAHICVLCGTPHYSDQSIPVTMYGTSQKGNIKIAGVYVKAEKWNRFMPAHLKVKSFDPQGLWKHGYGICPLCVLDALGIRYVGYKGELLGFLSVSISKPVPLEILQFIGRVMRDTDRLKKPIVEISSSKIEGVVLDYSSATVATTDVPEPRIENLFEGKILARIGKLLSWGIYPVKYLPSFSTDIIDKPVVTTRTFRILDFSVTSRETGNLMPWIAKLVEEISVFERSEALKLLDNPPSYAPLILLALQDSKNRPIGKSVYDQVVNLLSTVGLKHEL
jgi:hypothetical protein